MATKLHNQHEGELEVQRRRHAPSDRSDIVQQIVSDDMPDQHALFFQNLLYLAIATVDAQNRVWATLLVGAGITRVLSSNQLLVRVHLAQDDPFANAVLHGSSSGNNSQLFALLGVDFANRRRNKAAGFIRHVESSATDLVLLLETNENMGNCPKYITVRNLVPFKRTPQTLMNSMVGSTSSSSSPATLTPRAVEMITQASTIWIASKHTDTGAHPEDSDVGLNHRGGSPGFVRVYSDDGGAWFVCIPDYSGNRFYQTLGSIQSSRTAGVLVPDFQTGDLLHLTGEAENLFDEEAEKLMPRVTLVTRIKITAAVLVGSAIHLKQMSQDLLSPYNPPVRYLASEANSLAACHTAGNTATLIGVKKITSSTYEFQFEVASPVVYTPGGYIILSFADVKHKPYAHMNNANPQSLNDDYVRTWTISSVEPYDATSSVMRFSCTIKLVPTGAISPFLHSLARTSLAQQQTPRLVVPCLGAAGDFTCFSPTDGSAPAKMLWFAGGVGITPFLAFFQRILALQLHSDIAMFFSCRSGDLPLLASLLGASSTTARLSVTVFVSDNGPVSAEQQKGITIVRRRMRPSDVEPDHAARPAYLCGPPALTDMVASWLEDAGCPAIHQEKFSF